MPVKIDERARAEAIGHLVMKWQDAVQAYDEAVGEIAGLNGTERRCLAFLHDGPKKAGAIAAATGLTPAAITSLVDRLEARGYLIRRRSEKDRRQVLVEAGPAARELTARYYEPLARAGTEVLGRYSEAELNAVLRFLNDAVRIQEGQHAALKAAVVEGRG
jgi:DNA-binding MarR family transcriptional regulator